MEDLTLEFQVGDETIVVEASIDKLWPELHCVKVMQHGVKVPPGFYEIRLGRFWVRSL